MPDYGATYTDKQIAKLEKELDDVYSRAYKDIIKKEKEYLKKYQKKNKLLLRKVKNGEIDEEDYRAWQKGQVFQGERWKEKQNVICDILARTNSSAIDVLNGRTPKIFAVNANNMAYMLEHGAGVNFNFGLYSVDAVTNIIKNNPKLLPTKKLDPVKDKAWNRKKINRQVSLAIIEGEDIFKVADRIAKVTASQNYNSMLTMARTAMTGAQNAGRQLTLDNAKKKGIDVKKEWMATLDGHTRHTHRMLDGQKRDLDKPFEVDGMKIMYPGDPEAHPSLVYNCRCTMVGDIEDFPEEYERYDNIDGKPIKNMTYQEWEQSKQNTLPEVNESKSKRKFHVSYDLKQSVSPATASDDWFEYEKANAMSEYIRTGEMPVKDINGDSIDLETRERLAVEAELIQDMGTSTKTKYKTLYRGMVLDENEVRSMFNPGENYTFDTLSATTTDKGIAGIYMDVENAGGEGVPVLLEIQKPDGIYGFDRDGLEVVLPKGSEFKVVRNWMDKDGVVHISLYSKKGKNTKGR